MNGRLCREDLARSLTTRMRRSISGTCLLALVRLTLGPPGMDWIRGGKLVINVHRRDVESPIQVEFMIFFIGFKNRLDCLIGEVIDCCKTYLSAQGEKEWNLIYEKDVRCQCHFAMEFEKVFGNLDKVLGHMSWF